MKEKQTAVIILAAGNGTRMKSKLPKILHKIGGHPMVGHVMDTALHLNPAEIITVLSKQTKEATQYVEEYGEVVFQKEQLGTADAVKPALELLKDFDGNVLILYADTPLIESLTMASMLESLTDSDVSVLGFRPEDPAEYGRLVLNNNGEFERIVEFKDATEEERKNNLCNSGVMAADCQTLQKLIQKVDNKNANNEYYLTDVIALARESDKKCTFVEGHEDEVLGVNNRVQLSQAEYIFQQRMRYKMMVEGVTLIDPQTVYFSYDTKIGKDVLIEPNVSFGVSVWVDDNVHIKSFCHIEDADIGAGASIGPFARIRPGTEIAEDARIGNFVEVKNSSIKEGAKIGHLTYIGDAEVGSNANIGAGTVTCNYDGRNKYRTNIGANAFVGSNSALVAPVTLGEGAFIGAGSTITKDVDEGALAVCRARQVTKENWAKSAKKKDK